MGIIQRRFILERDPPFDVRGALSEIRRAMQWGTGELCFVLNIARGTLTSWEVDGCRPSIDHGDAIRKLLIFSRNSVTPKLVANQK